MRVSSTATGAWCSGRADPGEVAEVLNLIKRHHAYTGSPVARRVINEWFQLRSAIVKVMPRDYKRALERLQREETGAVSE